MSFRSNGKRQSITSEEYIEELQRNGVKLIRNNGSLVDIPHDFLKKATELCQSLHCSSITYEICDPHDSEHTKLRVLDCGFAEYEKGSA